LDRARNLAGGTALYPASTVLVAQSHLKERLARSQVAGLGVAGAAAFLIAFS